MPSDNEVASTPSPRRTLLELSRGAELFTTALIVKAGFDRDPIIECSKALNSSFQFTVIDCESPLFQGLGQGLLLGQSVNWDHRLYAAPRDDWDSVRDMLSGISWVDRMRKTYARTLFHELTIVDPTTLYASGELLAALPLLTITVFGVASNKRLTYISPASDPPRTRAFMVSSSPRAEEMAEANRLLGQLPSHELLSRHREDLQ